MSSLLHQIDLLSRSPTNTSSSTNTTSSAAAASTTKTTTTKSTKSESISLDDPGFWLIWCTLGFMGLLAIHHVVMSLWNAWSIHRVLSRRRRAVETKSDGNGNGDKTERGGETFNPSFLSRKTNAVLALWDNVFYLNGLPGWMSTYDVSETSFVFAYLGLNLGLCFYGTAVKSNAFGNQSGRIAFSQLPFIIGLAGKNNVISLVTGISYEKLNYLHRAAGRVNLLCSWIHAGYWFQKIAMGNLKHNFTMAYVRWGLVATISLTLLTFGGYKKFRQQFYEVFLYSHIILAALYLCAAYFHRVEYDYWTLPAIALWSLDRLARLAKILWTNLFLVFRSKGSVEADVEVIGSDALRMTLKRPGFTWTPGQHMYVVIPSVSRYPLEAHPYTIAGAPITTGAEAGNVTLIVRVRQGFTQRLSARMEKGSTTSLNAYIDGPYGTTHSFMHYDTVVLLAGGSGITHEVSQLIRVLRAVREGKSTVRHIVLAWMVRDREHWHWISSFLLPELADIPVGLTVDIRLHVTQSANEIDPVEETAHVVPATPEDSAASTPTKPESGSNSSGSSTSTVSVDLIPGAKSEMKEVDLNKMAEKHPHGCVSWKTGRADISELLDTILPRCHGLTALEVCGPATMKATAKAAIKQVASSRAISQGKAPRIVLYAESFDW